MRSALLRSARALQADAQRDEGGAEADGEDRVDRAEEPEDDRDQGQRGEQEGVEDDLAARLDLAVDHRHHRHPDARVLVLHEQAERPEVRRRPVEDDREEVERGGGDGARHGRPADQRRNRAGRAADDDVLRRAALEPERVDDRVPEEPGQREAGGEHVDGGCEQRKRGRLKREGVEQGRSRRDPPGRHRPRGRAAHRGVDVAVVPVVERARPAGAQEAADHRDGHEGDRGVARDVHRRDRRQEQQQLHLRLGERDVIGDDLTDARNGNGCGRRAQLRSDDRGGAEGMHGLGYRIRGWPLR